MAGDPYSVLGVEKTATDAEIKKAYRKLAKTLHPDLNPGDASAVDRFKTVSAAYKFLRNPEKRARFDRGEIDATGAERAEQRYYHDFADAEAGGRYQSTAGFEDFADASDIFSELFGHRRTTDGGRTSSTVRMRGRDAHYHLEIDFLDAVNGAQRRIVTPDGSTLDLSIPAGAKDGGTLRLKGKGGPGRGGGPAGDALVEIAVRPHPVFSRDGDDILLELPISIDAAVLGGKVEVPTVGGMVRLTVPKGSSSGDTLRLRGRGVKAKGRKPGDQKVMLKIVTPDRPYPELEAFLKKWRKTSRYDPRKNLRRT